MTDTTESIAVVIPALNEAQRIGSLLRSLCGMDFAEIVVADGGSSDGTDEIVSSMPRVRLIRSETGRGNQINAAVRTIRAPILVILHADTVLPAGAVRIIRETLRRPDVAAGCFRLSFDVASPVLDFYAWCSRFETSLTTFGDQAYFLRRAAFDAVGGAPEWPFLEDVALRDKLRRLGLFVKHREPVVTSARRFAHRGPILAQLRNIVVLAGYRSGLPVTVLARIYGVTR